MRSPGLPQGRRGGLWWSSEEEEKPIPSHPIPSWFQFLTKARTRVHPTWWQSLVEGDRDTMEDSTASLKALGRAAWSCRFSSSRSYRATDHSGPVA